VPNSGRDPLKDWVKHASESSHWEAGMLDTYSPALMPHCWRDASAYT
jgi:hypothetical protein